MLYPVTMSRHGPCRSLGQYLDYLLDCLRKAPEGSARELDLRARIQALEAEIDARVPA